MNGFTDDHPLVINWMISAKCNLDCGFCYGRFTKKSIIKKQKEIILDKIIESKIPKLIFTGGEPLLDEDILYLINKAKKNNIFISLHTNGVLLNTELLNKIKYDIGRVSLPLDGSNNLVNRLMRGKEDYYTNILNLIDLIKKNAIDFSLKTVASRINIFDIPNLKNKIEELNPFVWLITEFIPLRRGSINVDKYKIQKKTDIELLKMKLKNTNINLSIITKEELSEYPHFFIDSLGCVYTNGEVTDTYVGKHIK